MEERAFLVVNIANIAISAFLILSIKKAGWIEEMIHSRITCLYVIPMLFFINNTILVFLFNTGIKSLIVTTAFLAIPGGDLVGQSILQKKTDRLYDKYESSIYNVVNRAISDNNLPIKEDGVMVFLTNNQGVFLRGTEMDKCHIDLYLKDGEEISNNITMPKKIELMLELNYPELIFDVTLKR